MELKSFFPSFVHQRLLLFPPNCFCLSTAVAGFHPLFTSVCCSLLTDATGTSLQPFLVFRSVAEGGLANYSSQK